MSALLSADAPLTEEERNDLLAQEQALKKQLRQVRAKLGKEKNGMYTALTEAVDKAPVLSAGAAEDMEPPTAEELKPSDAEIAGNAMLDEINEQEMEKHYQKVYDYTIALKASLRDKDWIKKASVALRGRRGHSSQRPRPYAISSRICHRRQKRLPSRNSFTTL